MDYTALFDTLEFGECATCSCGEVVVRDDLALETEESLEVVLNRTLDLDDRITLSPTAAEIAIVDNDGTYDNHIHSLQSI